jgi:hypothetical protein
VNGNWNTQALQGVMAAIEVGRPVERAAEDFGIPPTSLRGHLMGTTRSRKRGKKPVMTDEEEAALVRYIEDMCDYAHPLNTTQLILKAAQLTQHWDTPFTNDIPRRGWLKWFRKRHPQLVLRIAQGLECNIARNLNERAVATFYRKFKDLYDKHRYEPSNIWNADESGCQAGRNGGARVLAKVGTRNVHQVMPNEQEHVIVLTCINGDGEYIPNLYIFKGKQRKDEYVSLCKVGAVYAMQDKAWMIGYIFFKWLDHFLRHLHFRGGISQINRHLFILDRYGSHVTLDMIKKAREHGLDLLTLPSHTSHALQPLDVSIFKPFKTAFKVYRDMWVTNNKGMRTRKTTLAQWISKSLKAALTPQNIQSGFRATGIWPYDNKKMGSKMTPSAAYREELEPHLDSLAIEDLGNKEQHMHKSEEGTQYYVESESDCDLGLEGRSQGDVMSSQGPSNTPDRNLYIQQVLTLPSIVTLTSYQKKRKQPVIDWSNSQLLTSEDNVVALEQVAQQKERCAEAKENR